MAKYIFVTGGVVSSLGKGIACASIGKILEARGFKINLIKCDPYINVDPGTMNPFQHGEVYVTDDGAETDLDLGHYERYTNAKLTRSNNVTTGKIYFSVISKERRGDYLGKTVQVVPHITDEIKASIKKVASIGNPDIVIVEIGGTVGDIESLPFLEAIRQLKQEMGAGSAINIHLTLVPFIRSAQEIKTKPTQHSVGKLREIGIQAEILLCRSEKPIEQDVKQKIALFCNVSQEAVVEALDVESIYEVPLMFKKDKLDDLVLNFLGLRSRKGDLKGWSEGVVEVLKNPRQSCRIAVVGKYITLQDAYKSIYEALTHAGIANKTRVEVVKIDSEDVKRHKASSLFCGMDGILVPGGFGYRGIEGKINAIQFARQEKVPYFGICLGMQTAVIEFARNVCGLKGANSTEFDAATPHPVISLLEEQKGVSDKGASMRLGAYPCRLDRDSNALKAYRRALISERHRHRYEFNHRFKKIMERHGLRVAGLSPDGRLVEIVELRDHPWFVAVQFHPEFKSKPDRAHPLFREFIAAALKNR
ncbi:MAG: CTP synthase [Candidatus Omnitrophota bacterium]